MAGPQKQDTDVRFAGLDGELPKIGIVGHDDPPRGMCAAQDHHVVTATQAFVLDRTNVVAPPAQADDDVWMNVLIRQERQLQWLHAGILRSQTTSFLSERAAYCSDASRPSEVICG